MSELLKINVNEHTERKGQLTYLSWAWAWAEVLKIDPKACWAVIPYLGPDGRQQPCMWIGDTAMVHTSVQINGVQRDCLLPVMDNRNNAVKNPDARKISDAIMRCMTKAIAMHGLGLYIYAGEDLPEGERADGLTNDRVAELESMAGDMLALVEDGREMEAIAGYYSLPNNEEKLCLWGFLKGSGGGSTPESRLRALIKANQPKATE